MASTKTFKLRAFLIENTSIEKKDQIIRDLLEYKLIDSIAQDRRMLLNPKDPGKEEDLIGDFIISEKKFVGGTMIRIRPSDGIVNIPENLFTGSRIILGDLTNEDIESEIIYKDHHYFMINNKYLITTLLGNKTITSFQTYINWLLKESRGNTIYEFTPKVTIQPNLQLRDLKSVKVIDPVVNENHLKEPKNITERNFLSLDLLKNFIKDVKTLDETELSEIISAELVIKFHRPKKMTKEEFQCVLGAYMKPISDSDNVIFYPKKGRPISGNDVLKIKEVTIEQTESNKISEQQLYQEMERFLLELENEDTI